MGNSVIRSLGYGIWEKRSGVLREATFGVTSHMGPYYNTDIDNLPLPCKNVRNKTENHAMVL
jgi:hypothetical protein